MFWSVSVCVRLFASCWDIQTDLVSLACQIFDWHMKAGRSAAAALRGGWLKNVHRPANGFCCSQSRECLATDLQMTWAGLVWSEAERGRLHNPELLTRLITLTDDRDRDRRGESDREEKSLMRKGANKDWGRRRLLSLLICLSETIWLRRRLTWAQPERPAAALRARSEKEKKRHAHSELHSTVRWWAGCHRRRGRRKCVFVQKMEIRQFQKLACFKDH